MSAIRNRMSSNSGLRRILLMGPVMITAAIALGPGSAVSAAATGGTYGYDVLWLMVAAGAFSFVFIDMGVRIGLALPSSPLQMMKMDTIKPIGAVVGTGYFVMSVLFLIGSMLGTIIGLRLLFGGTTEVWTVVIMLVSLAALWTGDAFRRVEFIMIALIAILIVAFAITAFLTQPDWGAVGQGFIPHRLPAGGKITVLLALLATNVEIYTSFYAAYTIREKGTTRAQYRATTLVDTLAGVVAPVVAVCFIIVAAGTVLEGRGVQEPTDITNVLEVAVGPAGMYIFAIGIFAAGFSSVIGNMTAGGTVFADGLNLGSELNGRAVKMISSSVLLAGGATIVVAGQAPVQLIILVNALSLCLLPFVAVMMFWLCNRKAMMGDLRNRIGHNILAIAAFTMIIWGAVNLAQELFG